MTAAGAVDPPVGASMALPEGAGAAAVGRHGRYAGIVSRSVGACVDAVALAALGVGGLFVLQAVLAMIDSVPFGDVTIESEWAVTIVFVQSALYFVVGWAVFGRSGGEALVGLRVVRRDGRPVGWGRATLRFLLSPLTYAVCGLGFVWMLVDSRRRTWTDLAVGTVVIYDWRRFPPD